MAAQLAAGLDGIERKLELEPELSRRHVPRGRACAKCRRPCARRRELLDGSAMLRAAFGDEVVDHYLRAARWEIEQMDRVVTDWEVARVRAGLMSTHRPSLLTVATRSAAV